MTVQELVEKHPKIFQPYPGNPLKINRLSIPEGWIPIVDDLCYCIQSYIDRSIKYADGKEVPVLQVKCSQMKEKFASLRFYYTGGDDFIGGMVEMASYLCEHTCQTCGNRVNNGVYKHGGWLSILCEECKK